MSTDKINHECPRCGRNFLVMPEAREAFCPYCRKHVRGPGQKPFPLSLPEARKYGPRNKP